MSFHGGYNEVQMSDVPPKSRKAVCLLSGGLDSSTCLALAVREFECYALSFDYGQRHRIELKAAARVAQALGAREHRTAKIDLRVFGGSALTADDLMVPKHRSAAQMGEGIPITYVPARNTIFLSYALAWAEVLESSDIFIGVNAIDYSGYPDCRPDFIAAFEEMANLATKAGVEGRTLIQVHTPLIELGKAAIVKLAADLHLDFALTHSCYDPAADGTPCGHCDSCLLRKKGFAEAGLRDPLSYPS
jgi:7-cyano-7-deazaguanine synthase